MSGQPNRAERRRIDRLMKKCHRKEEMKAMKSAPNAHKYNAKKSCKIAPHIVESKKKDEDGGKKMNQIVNKRVDMLPAAADDLSTPSADDYSSTCSGDGDDDLSTSSGDDLSSSGEGTEEASEIELAYAHALGKSVASYFLGKRLIFQTIYGGIMASHENTSLDQFMAYFFDDITTQMIDDVVRRALIATDFDAMDITQEIMDDLLDDIGNVFELMAENPNDPDDIAATNILWDLERLLAKALKEGCDDVIKKSLEEEFFYDGEKIMMVLNMIMKIMIVRIEVIIVLMVMKKMALIKLITSSSIKTLVKM